LIQQLERNYHYQKQFGSCSNFSQKLPKKLNTQFWLPTIARLGDQKFDNQIFKAMLKKISIISQKNLAIQQTMV
jgi:hypothetical protein